MIKPIILGGPTGSGKSEVAYLLAKRIGGEIISADAMAVYRGMDIGTAKPIEFMKEVKHHLISIVDPGEFFDVKLFEELALRAIEDITNRGKIPIIVGGSYLYIQAILFGIADTPKPNRILRTKLYRIAKRRGKEFLYRKLQAIDPLYAEKIHSNDIRRIVRALEVFIETGKPFSSFHKWQKPRYDFIGFYLKMNRERLFTRIKRRVIKMMEKGLLKEVHHLLEKGFEDFITAQQAIGYKELIPYIKGEISLKEAVNQIVHNTEEYAKRQIRWFRKQGWIEVDMDKLSPPEAVDFITEHLRKTPLSV